MNQVLDTIAARRSHRAYAPTQLTQEQLQILLKAGMDSPSAVNRQPWHFTVVQNQELLKEINQAVWEETMKQNPENRSPRFADPNFDVFYHAPTVIFISADKENYWNHMDSGIACQNICLAAESIGLGTVILGMPRAAFQNEKAEEFRKALLFPETHEFTIAIAVGTPTDHKPAHLPAADRISFVR